MEDLTGKQLGQYQIVGPLGEGGMAAVYKAYQPSMDRYVALKILPRQYASDPKTGREFVGRFQQEAKVIAKLQHPHILPVHDFGESDGYAYLVMPFVETGTLADLLQGQPLPTTQIRRIVSQVGEALHYAHSHGLIHRDIKPSNILIDESGNCRLTDFGIAKIVEGTSKFTRTGGIIGTPAYMSPEQGRGDKLDGRTDIYSLGIVLYEMATGRVPYDAETPIAVVFKHIQDPLPLPRGINAALSETLERVILKSLAKQPDDRFATAQDMVQALRAAVPETVSSERDRDRTVIEAAVPYEAVIETGPVAPSKRRDVRAQPKWRWAAVAVAVIFLAALVFGTVAVVNQRAAAPEPVFATRVVEVTATSIVEIAQVTATPFPVSSPTPAQRPTLTPRPSATPVPAGTILFEEDFQDGKAQLLQYWGAWTITEDETGNKAFEIDNAQGSEYPGMNFGSERWIDYVIEYRVKILESAGGAPTIILEFRRNVDGSKVRAYIQSFSINYDEVILAYKPNGGWQRLETRPFNVELGSWYLARVEMQGTQITVFVDGYLVAEATDTRLTKGSFQLAVGPRTKALLDDIQVIALEPDGEIPPQSVGDSSTTPSLPPEETTPPTLTPIPGESSPPVSSIVAEPLRLISNTDCTQPTWQFTYFVTFHRADFSASATITGSSGINLTNDLTDMAVGETRTFTINPNDLQGGFSPSTSQWLRWVGSDGSEAMFEWNCQTGEVTESAWKPAK